MSPRVLVAGIGNIFLGDDGFGVEVARRLAGTELPPNVTVTDYGIRGLHLAYDLLDGRHDTTIMVDALARGGDPGTLYLVQPHPADAAAVGVDAHGMHPAAVLALLRNLGGEPGRVLVLGCEPACLGEGIGLSAPVAAAVDTAARRVMDIAVAGGEESTPCAWAYPVR